MMGGHQNHNLDTTTADEVEKLSYIMDMARELMVLASEARAMTLVAILNAALIEAQHQKSDAERGT